MRTNFVRTSRKEILGMAADRKYVLKPLVHSLKQAVDARIKQLKPKGEWEQELVSNPDKLTQAEKLLKDGKTQDGK